MLHVADELMYEIKRNGKHGLRARRCVAGTPERQTAPEVR
jgi:hypothetical protein